MQPVANAHSTQCGQGRRCHQVHHLPRDQNRSAAGLQAARRKLRHLPRRAATGVSIGGASVGRRDGAQRRHLPVSGLGRELARDPEKWGTGFRTRSRTNKKRFRLLHRHPEARARRQVYAACASLAAKRASKGDGPDPAASWGRSSFEARPLAGHLRMTDNDRCIGCCDGYPPRPEMRTRIGLLHRHPEARAPQASLRSLRKLGCVRASKGDGPDPSASWGRSSFEARPTAGHLRMTYNDRLPRRRPRACFRRSRRPARLHPY
jgi:hypothetical protein